MVRTALLATVDTDGNSCKSCVVSLKTKLDKHIPKCEAKEQETENAGFLTTSLVTKADTAQGTTTATVGLELSTPTSACL